MTSGHDFLGPRSEAAFDLGSGSSTLVKTVGKLLEGSLDGVGIFGVGPLDLGAPPLGSFAELLVELVQLSLSSRDQLLDSGIGTHIVVEFDQLGNLAICLEDNIVDLCQNRFLEFLVERRTALWSMTC